MRGGRRIGSRIDAERLLVVFRWVRQQVEQREVDEFGRNRGKVDALVVLIRLGRGIFASLSLSHVGHSVSRIIMGFISVRSQVDTGRFCRNVRGPLTDAGFTEVAVVVFVQSLSLRSVYCRSHIMIGVGYL